MGAFIMPNLSAAPLSLGERFRFAAVNDLHITDEASAVIVERAVARINAEADIAFTVVLGDIGSWGLEREMTLGKAALDKLKAPYFCIPGNHDVLAKGENVYLNYDQAFGERQWFENNDKAWAFIGLDTCNGTASDVTVPPERVQWLSKQLEGIDPARPIALFTHHPLNPNTKAYRVKNADEILGVFKGHTLKMVASGHYHGNQIEESEGILFTTTACCSSTRGNFDDTPEKGFRIFNLDKSLITHDFIEIEA